MPVSKKLRAQKTQKISASKKTQGPFWAKNSVCWSQFEISAKKLWNFDHLKPILTDFMVKNETFKDFLIILAQNSCIWGEMFKILKKKPSRFWGKTQQVGKKTQCYGVFRTQCDSLKSVKKKACLSCFLKFNIQAIRCGFFNESECKSIMWCKNLHTRALLFKAKY